MQFPDGLLYTDHDEWIRREGDSITVGISDYAQDALGELVHVELPEVGESFSAGDVICEVESVKSVAEIFAPADGTISEVNEAIADEAEKVNSAPYESWLFKMTMSDSSGLDKLMDAAGYRAKVDAP
jgi:glycine cleavage system H protein